MVCSCSASMLHIYTAKGLRECAFAAAERLRDVGRLDAKEHKGKVSTKTSSKVCTMPLLAHIVLGKAETLAQDLHFSK